jgi:single-strand DNA-binding protein
MGRLTRDPELRHTPSGAAVTSFGLAVDKFSREESTRSADFFDLVCWERKAEFATKWLRKGTKVVLCGRLQQRSWKDKEGNNRVSVEIVVEDIEFAESKATSSEGGYSPPPPLQSGGASGGQAMSGPSSFQELHDDDGELPF